MNGLVVCGILSAMIYFYLFNMTCAYFILTALSLYFLLSWVCIPWSAFKYNNPRRKIMISSWSDPIRPNLFGYFKVKASDALVFLEKASIKTGKTITMPHLVAKAFGKALTEFPELVGKIDLGNFKALNRIDCSFMSNITNDGLSVIPITDVPSKPFSVLAQELLTKSEEIGSGSAFNSHKSSFDLLEKLPTCLLGVLLEIMAFLNMTIGLKLFGLKPQYFGSFIIIDSTASNSIISYPTLYPIAKNLMTINVTSIHDEAIVENSELLVLKMCYLCITVDHRFVDGMKAVRVQNRVKKILENPEEFFSID